MMMHSFFLSGNNFNKMHLWQNLGAGQNGKTQEVCIWHNAAMSVFSNEEVLSPLTGK